MASHLRRRSLNLETNGSAATDPRLGVQVPPLTAPHPHRARGSGQGKGTGAQEGTESGPAPPRPTEPGQAMAGVHPGLALGGGASRRAAANGPALAPPPLPRKLGPGWFSL